MTLKIITGYTGNPHITPADDAGFHKAIFGEGDYVLNAGSQFAATQESATEIRIADGELVMQGRHARNDSGFQAVTIANGSQGMYRNDLIVARYTIDNKSVESISLVVITGTATSGTASDPAYNTGDIESGQTRDFPLYRVKLNGVNIDKVEKLWESPVLSVERGGTGKTTVDGIKSLLGLAKAAFVNLVTVALGGTGKSSHTSNAVLTGNGTNPVNNVPTANGALYATTTNGAAKFGTLPIAQGGTGTTTLAGIKSLLGLGSVASENTLPISKGGTGSTTQAGARTNLGLDGKLFTQYGLNGCNIDNTGGNWTAAISTSGYGTVPTTWVNVTQFQNENFYTQVAMKCDGSSSATARDQRMWIRDKQASVSGAVWSNWKEILTTDSNVLWTKVWGNGNSGSAFGGQDITNVTYGDEHNLFLCVFKSAHDAEKEFSVIARRNEESEIHIIANIHNSGDLKVYARRFKINTGYQRVTFYDCSVKTIGKDAVTTDSSKLIPVAIYACKG